MLDFKIQNNTRMSDLEHFQKIICLIYELNKRMLKVKNLEKYDYEETNIIFEQIMIEVILELEIDSSEYLGFVDSALELFNSLALRENIYVSFIGKYYYEHFKPADYVFLSQSKMKAFRKNKLKLLSSHDSNTVVVQISDAIQYALANMQIVESLSHKLNAEVAEHNCIVRNEIDFKIAYIELLNVLSQNGISSNLYWIEGDSINPEDAILTEKIGNPSNLYEVATAIDNNNVTKRAA